ncbi:hypothetical protein [Malacoplasma iowae]|uniref:Uncharacterized protein n=1 Tax=Malacoplasma iowae 695 TaxID=1048830 RepID=A0A6P1LJE2_MALIO|nr:hypothetical protein [Malacoplasma iowae]VEU61583.1 Uncharacterised protein [Mycoplasmopsis fermentans]EGZ31321.1 hypothetical protein GUU_02618 [Malacoplasma iowae 695]QHG89324.1 hypothetical protein EER00_00185 [Malacoplasma iowae 695]QHG90255.1 hypothetical protein EER00_05265 [Malacoplasma iowae 695]WPL35974.1 hypothetical protein QX180_00940 [Malacoplasma iowae]
MEKIEIKSSQIFDAIKKFLPIYLKYIKYFTLLFITMFVCLGLTSSIIYLINCNQSWNAVVLNPNTNNGNIIINRQNYYDFNHWLFTNKNAVYIAFVASFFGFATCLSLVAEVILMIKDNKVVKWKLYVYFFVFILFFVSSFMMSYGFNNSNIPIGIENNLIKTQGPLMDTQVIKVTESKVPWTKIELPGSSSENTMSQINISIGDNPEKGNYIPYLVSTISISVLGNILYLVNKILRKLNIKIIWDGFKNKGENDKVNEISDSKLNNDMDNIVKLDKVDTNNEGSKND